MSQKHVDIYRTMVGSLQNYMMVDVVGGYVSGQYHLPRVTLIFMNIAVAHTPSITKRFYFVIHSNIF